MKGIINITKKYGSKTILTFPAKGNTMKYNKELSQRFKSSQIWVIGYPDNQGWFNISSSKAESKYLTVTKIGYRNELTMEAEASPGDESQILEIEDVILHPMYDFTKAYQDIAVIKLKANQGKL